MISIKSKKDIDFMRQAGEISADALAVAGKFMESGIKTAEIDKAVYKFIVSKGARPSFLGYGGFPGSCCISINNEVIHGIPSDRRLRDGDLVSVDVGAEYNGYHGDNAYTFMVGRVTADAKKLVQVTKESLMRGIKAALAGNRIGDISFAVSSYCESFGFFAVRDYVGHGIGRSLHEEPQVPNYVGRSRGTRLMPGMTIAIEPMINELGYGVNVLNDGWTVVTAKGGLSAHFEHTVLITADGPEILTTGSGGMYVY